MKNLGNFKMNVISLSIIAAITLIACDGDYTLADGNSVIKKQDNTRENNDSISFLTIEKSSNKLDTSSCSIKEKNIKILRSEISELKDKMKKLKKVKKYNQLIKSK